MKSKKRKRELSDSEQALKDATLMLNCWGCPAEAVWPMNPSYYDQGQTGSCTANPAGMAEWIKQDIVRWLLARFAEPFMLVEAGLGEFYGAAFLELVEQGRIKSLGHGCYQTVEGEGGIGL